jgi:hypothetical protein
LEKTWKTRDDTGKGPAALPHQALGERGNGLHQPKLDTAKLRPKTASIHSKVLLDETDALTSSLIKRLLQSGVKHLSPIQQEIIRCSYLQKIRAPKRHFRDVYQMDGPMFDAALVDALQNLRAFFERSGISGLYDIL